MIFNFSLIFIITTTTTTTTFINIHGIFCPWFCINTAPSGFGFQIFFPNAQTISFDSLLLLLN
jgi:hypothetical protein